MGPLALAALQLAPIVPRIFDWITNDKVVSSDKPSAAEQIASVAQAVTGKPSMGDAVMEILGSPNKQNEFRLAMQERSDGMDRAFLADRADARKRDLAIVKLRGKNERADNLAYLAAFAFIACIAILSFVEIPRGSRDLLLVLTGALVTILKDVYSFDFGSSKGSERNAQALADYLTTQRTNGNGKH